MSTSTTIPADPSLDASPLRQTFLPFALPSIGREEKDAVARVMDSGWLTYGPETRAFEEEFRHYVNAPYALSVSSCTAALHLALLALDIGVGDEVITTPMTFAATANVICHCGATPVFADIDPQTLNLTTASIEQKITKNTKAILLVHMAGRPCPLDEVHTLAKKHGLPVIEDAAHALGSEYRGRPIGSLSDFTCFSFYPTKNLTAGEGGMITTPHEHHAEKMRMLSMHGMSHNAWTRYYPKNPSMHWELLCPGYKYNMTDLQAAIGRVQLKKLQRFQERRLKIAQFYLKELSSISELILPEASEEGIRHCWHLFILRTKCTDSHYRDAFAQALKRENIGVGFHFIGLHEQPYYKERFFKDVDVEKALPNATAVSRSTFSIPLYPSLTDQDCWDVVRAIEKIARSLPQ